MVLKVVLEIDSLFLQLAFNCLIQGFEPLVRAGRLVVDLSREATLQPVDLFIKGPTGLRKAIPNLADILVDKVE